MPNNSSMKTSLDLGRRWRRHSVSRMISNPYGIGVIYVGSSFSPTAKTALCKERRMCQKMQTSLATLQAATIRVRGTLAKAFRKTSAGMKRATATHLILTKMTKFIAITSSCNINRKLSKTRMTVRNRKD